MRILSLLCCLGLPAACQTKAIFYMDHRADSLRSFLANAGQIDILIPTVYQADEHGAVRGAPDSQMLEAACAHGVRVMPIIVNTGFKQELIHALLADGPAQSRMADFLLAECGRHEYYGIQFDFENVSSTDRDALTALVRH